MREKSIIKALVLLPFTLALILPNSASGAPATSEVTKVNIVSFLPLTSVATQRIGWLADRVTKQSNGQIAMKFVGGPEVIAPPNQAEAVRTGSMDACYIPPGFVESYVPEAFAMTLTQITPWEERKNGFIDYLQKKFKEKMGVYFLGRSEYAMPQSILPTKKISWPKELKGFRIVSTNVEQNPFLTALGATPVMVSTAEIYTAMERKMAEGIVVPLPFARDSSIYEVVKFFIEPGVWSGATIVLINQKKWDSIPKNLQLMVVEIWAQIEHELTDQNIKRCQEARQKFIDSGATAIKFSPEDEKWFVDLSQSSMWQHSRNKVSAADYEKLREYLSKK